MLINYYCHRRHQSVQVQLEFLPTLLCSVSCSPQSSSLHHIVVPLTRQSLVGSLQDVDTYIVVPLTRHSLAGSLQDVDTYIVVPLTRHSLAGSLQDVDTYMTTVPQQHRALVAHSSNKWSVCIHPLRSTHTGGWWPTHPINGQSVFILLGPPTLGAGGPLIQ